MPGLKIKERNGVYYAVGSFEGKRIRTSLGTREKAQAAELCALLEAKLWKRRNYGEEAVRTFEEAALAYMKAGGERQFLPPLIARFRARVLGSIKPEEIRLAAQAIYPKAKPGTWNRNGIVPARAVINYAAGLGWCPIIAVKNYPTERARRRPVDRAWLDRFLDQADHDELPHLAAAVLFMWQTGTRVGEVVRILPEHIDLGQRMILLERTKTGEWQAAHITRELVVRIANLDLVEGRTVFGYADRVGLARRMKAVCRRAGLPWHSPHEAGRHSYATNALAKGATIKQVMEGGRWKSARMVLEIYAHAEDGGKAIAEIFDTERAQSKSEPDETSSVSKKDRA